MQRASSRHHAVGALIFWGIAVLVVGTVWIAHIAIQTLLMTFAGALFGVSIRGVAARLANKLRLPIWLGLVISLLLAIGAAVLGMLWLLPRVVEQMTSLVQESKAAYEGLHPYLAGSDLGQRVLDRLPDSSSIGSLGRLAGWLSTSAGIAGSLVFVAFVALYTAISPGVYRHGVIKLVPLRFRERAQHLLDELARTLRRWLAARAISMAAVGASTSIGLFALGVPLPIPLGLIAGLLGFIPNIGPLVSAIPALLIAATLGFPHVIYVAVLYAAINLADGFVLTPLIQKRAVSTPAALVMTSQLVFGALWGLLGVMLATPLVACAIVIIRTIYVDGILEPRPDGVAD